MSCTFSVLPWGRRPAPDLRLQPLLVLLLLIAVLLHLVQHLGDLRVAGLLHLADDRVVQPDARALERAALVQQIQHLVPVPRGQLGHRFLLSAAGVTPTRPLDRPGSGLAASPRAPGISLRARPPGPSGRATPPR